MKNSSGLRVVALATTDPSDIYFANQMLRCLNVVGVVIENHFERPLASEPALKRLARSMLDPKGLPKKIEAYFLQARLTRYLQLTRKTRDSGFGQDGQDVVPSGDVPVFRTQGLQDINQPENVEVIRSMNPEVIVVCGCSILKKKIMSLPTHGSMNLHGGLSQRYRGTWPTYWSFHNKDPEYIGATVHFVSKGIDNGQIVYQARPELCADDNPEAAYVKVVKLGSKMMIQAVKDIEAGTIQKHPLHPKGELYLSRMMTNQALLKLWKNYEAGVVGEYLREKERRDTQVLPLIEQTKYVNGS